MSKSSGIIVFTVTASLLWAFLSAGIADGLDIDGAKEQPCFEIKKTTVIDMNWVMNSAGETWYYPLMSRLDLYVTSLEVSDKDAIDLQENEVYYDSCIQYEMVNDVLEIVGFGGRRSPTNVTASNDTESEVKGCYFTNESGISGISYPTLTDNSTFIFHASCLDGDQMTWSVSSNKKSLPKGTVKKIYDHAESLGFKREFFTGIRYDNCNHL